MGMTAEKWWVVTLCLLAKCGGGDPSGFLAIFTVVITFFSAATALSWLSPGGCAWGEYYSSGVGRRGDAIPGPRGAPFVGSMGLMTGLAHRKLAAEAKRLGAERLMALSLGGTRVIVTSTADVAREILTSPDFADRPVKESAYRLMFHRAIGFAPYGRYWRDLRRIASTHLFSPKQIALSADYRSAIASQMVGALTSSSSSSIEVRPILKQASLHNIMWSVFGRRYELGSHCPELQELRLLVDEGYDLLGKLNWSDHLSIIPALGLDPQDIRRRCSRLQPRVNIFVSNILHEHMQNPMKNNHPDFVHVLLSLDGSDRLSDDDVVAVLWEMIFRGTDTVAVAMEWVLARLAVHGDVQARVHSELDRVVGRERAVAEADAAELHYLHAVIKETLRVHPPAPLMSWARSSTRDTLVDARPVPAGTTAIVNMWAITHDPGVWADPLAFRPERFLAGDNHHPHPPPLSVLGADLRLAPFGAGRRSCPGKVLAMATVAYWVATLMHEFEIVGPKQVDLAEVLRLSCEMAVPLAVTLRRRR